jgi:hypothetical protein
VSYVPPRNKEAEGEHGAKDPLPNIPPPTTGAQQQPSDFKKKECTKEAEPKQKWHELDLQDRLIVLLTAGIFLVAALTAYIFLRQADLMEGQLEEMKGAGNQTERLIMLSQGQLIAAAKFAGSAHVIADTMQSTEQDLQRMATASEGSIRSAQEALRLDQRAWMGISQPTLSANPGQVLVVIKNYGKSPAKNVEAFIHLEIDRREMPFVCKIGKTNDKSDIHGMSVMVPGEPSTLQTDPRHSAIPPPILTDLGNGTLEARFSGRIDYQDVFDRPHYTTFCQVFFPDLQHARMYKEGNEIQ